MMKNGRHDVCRFFVKKIDFYRKVWYAVRVAIINLKWEFQMFDEYPFCVIHLNMVQPSVSCKRRRLSYGMVV